MSDISRRFIKILADTIVKSTNNKVVLFTKDISDLLNKLAHQLGNEGDSKGFLFSNPQRKVTNVKTSKINAARSSSSGDGEDGSKENPVKNATFISKEDITSRDNTDFNNKTKDISAESINKRTSLLMGSIKTSTSNASLLKRIENLNTHLKQYPDSALYAIKAGALKQILILRRDKQDVAILQEINETLSLMGYCDPPPSPGVRILTIDGGGMRGLIVINILQQLEVLSGKRIHQLFDYICGVSTGAMIAFCSVPPIILPLDKLREVYMELGKQIFKQNALKGASKLVLHSAYYETALLENLLKKTIGPITLLETIRYPESPKISVLSTVGNRLRVGPFLFRNYAIPNKTHSDNPGSCSLTVFDAVRASSAAPSVFEEFRTENYSHLDGGIVANNPTGIAIHEVKSLWPTESISCLVSCGTGRYPPEKDESGSSSWKRIIHKVLESATDTEGVHQIVKDLLHDDVYYRFNPTLNFGVAMDEINEEKIALMEEETAAFCKKNQEELLKAVGKLQESRSLVAKLFDHVKLQIKLSE